MTNLPTGAARPPEPWESGWKDTVISYPGEITRVKAKFDVPGLYVWHCHIVEHEDNEMMRPYFVGDQSDHHKRDLQCDIQDPDRDGELDGRGRTYQLTATGYGKLSYNPEPRTLPEDLHRRKRQAEQRDRDELRWRLRHLYLPGLGHDDDQTRPTIDAIRRTLTVRPPLPRSRM